MFTCTECNIVSENNRLPETWKRKGIAKYFCLSLTNVIEKTDNNAGQPWNRFVRRPGSAPQHWGIKNPDMEWQRVVAKTYLKLKYNLFLRYLLKRIILSLSSVVGIVTCQLQVLLLLILLFYSFKKFCFLFASLPVKCFNDNHKLAGIGTGSDQTQFCQLLFFRFQRLFESREGNRD